jgi:hypothetical protein
MATVQIRFDVAGSVTQTVRILDPKISPEILQKLLRSGEAATTIQEGGNLEYLLDGKLIGVVENVDNDCEYSEYEVE